MISVHAPGSLVRLHRDIEGRVLSIQIDDGRVSYRVVWWHDGKREIEWFEAFEVEADKDASELAVGFRSCSP